MKKIAVLLACFNRREKTLKCLEELFSCNLDSDYEINVFLVDDNSSDQTADAVKSFYPQVNVIEGNGSLYWNRGMNLAWTEARKTLDFDYYLWLNDDITLFKNALVELLSCIEDDMLPYCICGASCSEKDGKFTYGGYTKLGVQIIPNGNIQRCDIINGNCVLINQRAAKLVGNLDPVFPHAIGDHDYGFRLIKAGGIVLTTKSYIAFCERNVRLPKWCYSDTPLKHRLKALYSPLGYSHPLYFFIYEKRHFGIPTAIKHYISIHLRALIPSLWK
jgi:GT2 family glycosyltransferase